MIPAIAVAVILTAVAGCCIYLSYCIGQSISPASLAMQRRLARVEAGVARSEARSKQTLEQHRQATSEQTAQLLKAGAEEVASLVQSLRGPIHDLHERLNAVRVDVSRESRDMREDLESLVGTLRNAKQEYLEALENAQAATHERIAGQLRDLGAEDERRHESARILLQHTAADLKDAHAANASEVRGVLAAHVAEVQEAASRIDRRIGDHGVQLGRTDEELRAALGAHRQQFEALEHAVEDQLRALRTHTAQELEGLHETSTRQDAMWQEIKSDFDALGRALLNIKRAIEVVRNQLTIPLRDADAQVAVEAVLDRSLQPDEFAQDVEIEPGTGRRIGIAVRLSDNPVATVWLPIAVLPSVQGYHELVAAGFHGDADQLHDSGKTFDLCVRAAAEDLRAKFIAPPHTMNLGILFVPTDDVYGEVARRETLVEVLRRDLHVIVAGPLTLPTLVNGLREAFRGTGPSRMRSTNGSALGSSRRAAHD
jgi:DNA recombination protein RmuC